MSQLYILKKGKDVKHTYSINIRKKLLADGYKFLCSVSGWNMSVGYKK